MPPKKRKKKRVVLTDEERLLLMQQKLLAEEEMHKKKEDMLAQFLKDKLAKEERNSVLNMNKINLQWRTVLREVKAKELRKDIEILSQTFERVVDCKDSVIRSLAKDLAEAEAQYAHALRSHLHNIDKLLELQQCRLRYLGEDYKTELEILQKEFEIERKMIIAHHEQETRYLQDVLLAMDQNYNDSDYEARLDFQSTRDDVKNKNLEEKHYLRMQLEGKVEELWKRFQQALRNYTEATEDRKLAFEALKLRDEKSTKEIERQMKKLQKLQELIALLKNKIAVHARESEEQNRRVRDDKEIMLKQLQKLKSQMNRARAKARSNLAKLSRESNATLKKLELVVEKTFVTIPPSGARPPQEGPYHISLRDMFLDFLQGELILRWAEMCRRLESEEEKVLPFYVSSLNWEEQKAVDKVAMEKPIEALAEMMEDYVGLERFWQRYNKVRLEQLSLERTKTALLQDNLKLKNLLKQYLDGISVNDEVLSQINPLMIINQNPITSAPPQPLPVNKDKPVYNVVEAAHEVSRIL